MRPGEMQTKALSTKLQQLHGPRLQELEREASSFASYLRSLSGFRFVDAELPAGHVGVVIVDGVLQVAHDYEKQVRKRVALIQQVQAASTVSGFIHVLQKQGIVQVLKWNSMGTEKDMLDVAGFFAKKGLDMFSELRDWIEPERNRDSLLSENSGLGGRLLDRKDPYYTTFKIKDKTADYFRKLVGHWDAVAVDKGIRQLLCNAHIVSCNSRKYAYKEQRAIFQLAALQFGHRPVDLDSSAYDYYVANKDTMQAHRCSNRRSRGGAGVSSQYQGQKYCIQCGILLPQRAKFCRECGEYQL